MSDDEMHSDEGRAMAQDTGPSEAELALQKRKQQMSTSDLDEFAAGILEESRKRREALEEEIEELRLRNERRKKERAEEEKALAARRNEEDARRKAEEEERNQKKKAEEAKKREARAARMAEFEKWKQPQERNFVITKREGGRPGATEEEGEEKGEKKSKEQLEAEKRAILAQRIHPLEIAGFDSGKLSEKARELWNLMYRLESEKYDLEKRFKEQQYDMLELAERARSMNKVGKTGLKRVQMSEEADKIQEKYSGTSAKIEMYSKYERQKDKRDYSERRTIFSGPTYVFPAERIQPQRIIQWDEDGLPIYEGGALPPPAPEPAQEEVAAEEE